ncbi:unnamed protein product [Ixodes hexagonus]
MSESTQVVFAIDVASFHTHEDKAAVGDHQQAVNAVRYSCLKLLTYFGRERTRWGYKFYSSNGLARQRMDRRPFREFNLDHFEEFEDELARRFDRYRSACEAMGRAGQNSVGDRDPPCAILRTAVTQIASEYPWDAPCMASPVKRRKRKRSARAGEREKTRHGGGNYVFNVSRCPRSDAEMAFFLGREDVTGLEGNDVAEELVPAQVRRLLVVSLAAKLVWIDAGLGARHSVHGLIHGALSRLGGDAVPLEVLARAGAGCAPFSAVADLCLKGGQRQQPSLVAAAVTFGEQRVGSALFCPDASPSRRCDATHWKELRILGRTRACAAERALRSRRIEVLRCPDGNVGTDDSARLRRILEGLQRHGEVLFVELTSGLPARQYAFLSPLGSCAFCLQVVTELPPFAKHWTDGGRLPQSLKTVNRDLERCVLPEGDPVEYCVGRVEGSDEAVCRLPFRAASLECWYVAPSAASLFPESNQRDSDEACGDMLKRLQHSYKPGCPGGTKEKDDAARPRSEQPARRTPRHMVRKSLSASFNPSGRSADILAHSYTDVQKVPSHREKASCGALSSPAVPQGVSYDNGEQLLAHLRESYSAVLDSNLSTSLLTCAQNIVSVIKRFVESQPWADGKQASVCELLRTHFVLGCPQIADKYTGPRDDASHKRRLREYQLQVLLALEEEVSFGPTGSCVDRVTSLLRTLSFVHSPSAASEFLRGVVRDTYLTTLRDILIEVGDELSVPLCLEDQGSLLGSEGDFGRPEQPASAASLESQDSFLSSIPSSFNSQAFRDAAESRSLARVDLSQPCSSTSLSMRQIVVPRVPKRARSDAKSVLGRPDAKPVRTSPRKQSRVCRDLFTATTGHDAGSPQSRRQKVLKTTFVPETPSRRQGRRLVQRRQELLRRKSSVVITVPVVEETPEKRPPGPVDDSPYKPGNEAPENIAVTPKRALHPGQLLSQETPPKWNGSESLFSSPEGRLSRSSCERTPAKTVLFSGIVVIGESPQSAQKGGVTPRRKVSKKLLSSPAMQRSPPGGCKENSPALKRPCLKSPSSSQRAGLSDEPETPRRLFRSLADLSPREEPDVGDSLQEDLPNGTGRGSSGGHSSPVPNGDSSRGVLVNQDHSPVLTKLTTRFTRSKSKETGLSPQQLFLLSQASPVKGERQTELHLHGANATPFQDPSKTPRHRRSRKAAYTPPSALSLLHLTSSPMLLRK